MLRTCNTDYYTLVVTYFQIITSCFILVRFYGRFWLLWRIGTHTLMTLLNPFLDDAAYYFLPILSFHSHRKSLYGTWKSKGRIKEKQYSTLCVTTSVCSQIRSLYLKVIQKPKRCNNNSFIDLQEQLNMFRANFCPSSGAQDWGFFYNIWYSVLLLW